MCSPGDASWIRHIPDWRATGPGGERQDVRRPQGVAVGAMPVAGVAISCSGSRTASQVRGADASGAASSSNLQCAKPGLGIADLHGGGVTAVTVHLRSDATPEEVLDLARSYTPEAAGDVGVVGAGFVD